MNNTLHGALSELSCAKSCAVVAHWLHVIVGEIMASDPDKREAALSEVVDGLKCAAYKKLNEHKSLPEHDPWYIATGTEADLMYLIYQIGDDCDTVDPRATLAAIACFASKLESEDDYRFSDVGHVEEIFSYCEIAFSCFSNSRFDIAVLLLPDVNFGSLAECRMLDEQSFGMILDARNTVFQLSETFAYELAAIMIAADDIPDAAIHLLARTTTPNVEELSEEGRFWQYLQAIKSGLAYGGPYGCAVNGADHNILHAQTWNEYLKMRFHSEVEG